MTCDHEWVEDELFACGAITMLTGTIDDMGEETPVTCTKCGARDFVPKDVFKRVNLLDEIKNDQQ